MNADFHINGRQLETERLILRRFAKEDLDDFYTYASVEGVGEMAGWKHHASKEETQKILDMFIEGNQVFAIYHKEDQKVIGSLGVHKYGRDYWGIGIMPEAVKIVIKYLFNELNYDFLLCGHFSFNQQSKRVQEKCGFQPYRKLMMTTSENTKEPIILNLLINPHKNITLEFSHPETLIYPQNISGKHI